MGKSKKKPIVKDKTGHSWYNRIIRRRQRIEIKQMLNLNDILEYNISHPHELVNQWDICDYRFVLDCRKHRYTPEELRKYCCK